MNTDYIILNESECVNLTGITDPVSATKIILSNIKFDGNVVVTMGKKDVYMQIRKRS